MEESEIKSLNIKEDLIKFSKENHIDTKDLDYDISKVYFYQKIKVSDKYKYKPIVFDPKENYRSNIIQKYQIKIKVGSQSYFRKCATLKVYENNMKASLIINNFSFRSLENDSQELKSIFVDINKIKAENKILVKVFSDNIKNEIIEFIKHAQKNKTLNNYEIKIFDSTTNKNANRGYRVKYSFKENNNSYVVPVEAGQLVMKYKKPFKGINNISAFGSVIKYPENDLINIYNYSDETIDIKEEQDIISMFSKTDGFIMLVDNEIKIQNVVQTKSLRGQTSNIISSKKHKIDLDIIATDEDNIALEDIVIEANNINIVGDIGKNVKITSLKVTQDGKAIQDSLIQSNFLSTNEFTGKFQGLGFKSEVVTNSAVFADNINITKVSGGFLKGKKIRVENLLSDVTITVKEKFKATDVIGSNSFHVQMDSTHQHQVEKNRKNIAVIDQNIKTKTEELKKVDNFIKNNQEKIKKLNVYIAKCKKNGEEYSLSIFDKTEKFNKQLKKFQILNNHIKVLINTKIDLNNEIEKIKLDIPDVQFDCENGWGGKDNNRQQLFIELGEDTHILELDNNTPKSFGKQFIQAQIQMLKAS
jgi:hypothetical protein